MLVTGKVLGSGVLTRQVSVAALNFSKSATLKIESANGTCMTIEDLIRNNPAGSRIRILR
jgi:large subunit ribosomal protein L18e